MITNKSRLYFATKPAITKSALLVAAILLAGCTLWSVDNDSQYYSGTTNKPYADVLTELQIAIAEHNFRITAHSRVGKIISGRIGRDFGNYDTHQFCNLTYARTLLVLDPHAIIYMPCNIVTYQIDGKTTVKTRLMPSQTSNHKINKFASKMNAIIKGIVDFALE